MRCAVQTALDERIDDLRGYVATTQGAHGCEDAETLRELFTKIWEKMPPPQGPDGEAAPLGILNAIDLEMEEGRDTW